MQRQARPYALASLLGLGLCASGCAQLLGLDEFSDQTPGGTGAGGLGGADPMGAGGAGGAEEEAPTCTPDVSEVCYAGPLGTRNRGACREGTRTCGADGTWGACNGEVVPAVERCDAADDENCDGFQCIVWATGFEQNGSAWPLAVESDAEGNVFVSASFSGTIKIAGEFFSSASGSSDALILKLSPTGIPLWAKKFGDFGVDSVTDLAIDAKGNLVLIGESPQGGVDFGGGPLPEGPYIVRLDASGKHVWSNGLGGRGTLTGIAIDSSDDIIVTGRFSLPIDLGEGPITPDGEDILVAKLDGANGRVSGPGYWVRTFNGSSWYEAATAVAVDSSKNIFFLGWSDETINFGTDNVPLRVDGTQFVVKLTPAGKAVWATALNGPGSGHAQPMGITVDLSSRPVIVGSFSQKMQLGEHTVTGGAGTDRNVFVVQLEATGMPRWLRGFGEAASEQHAYGVTRDPSGNLVVGGTAAGEIDFGSGPLKAQGLQNAFVAKFTPDAELLWNHLTENTGEDILRVVATSPDGETLIAGTTTAPHADFGTGPLPGTGDGNRTRLVIAKLGR
ncbi:hypothetical protein WME95_19315 [Sorangium sp. So ce327]|uniref:SBBP repeat-containing protein n=1 Tax=Sorangium sp. So ce327 TaxID=3133301 RepID=UPI003F64350A